MLSFDIILGLTLLRSLILDKIREEEEKRKKKKERTKCKATLNEVGDIAIEESIKLPSFRYKTLVLLGIQSVARRPVKVSLVNKHPDKYGYPPMFTSRARKPHEVNGTKFTFVSRHQMIRDIRNHKFVEHGMLDNEYYGIKLDSIRSIHREGKMAIVDIQPQTLRYLRNAEFAPYVVFIAPPLLHNVLDYDGSLARLMNESDQMRRDYAHLIDAVIVMNDMDEAIAALEVVAEDILNSPQWVLSSWVQGQR